MANEKILTLVYRFKLKLPEYGFQYQGIKILQLGKELLKTDFLFWKTGGCGAYKMIHAVKTAISVSSIISS